MRRAIVLAALLGFAAPASAITRTEVMVRAKSYALHPWTVKPANMTASCSAAYKSIYQPGDYIGLPYDWGGYMTLAEFDQQIADGLGAGSQPSDGVLACTAGVDCSGFVSGCWKAGHFTTSSLHMTSAEIAQADLLAGDAINKAGEHVVLFSHLLAGGDPVFYESGGYNAHVNPFSGWSYVMGYLPRRYNSIEETTAADPVGTVSNPITIGAFPYSDDRNTAVSMSDVFDKCSLGAQNESGPEYVYKVKITQPGQLTVSVTDDAGADIDVHLYSSFNTQDCVARNDATFTQAVDCGTYYVVADTFTSGSGALAGNYHLTVSFTPTGGAACGAGPHVYKAPGGPGEACRYPGHETLPFCNPNLGADTCVYTTSGGGSSVCSHPCKTAADCGEYTGGCCEDLGGGEKYCLPGSWCGGGATTNPNPTQSETDMAGADDGGTPGEDADGGTTGGGGGGDPGEGGCALSGRAPRALPFLGAVLFVAIIALARRRRRVDSPLTREHRSGI